uniref:Suppression of tumorigenicity 7 n=1 Tax=Nomascus leucogenys TaxID=61853 RepID=A0A2I3GF39_NOMLE
LAENLVAATGFLEQLKSCIVWSWTYLWTVWFFIVLFLVYILRVPLKINDNLSTDIRGLFSSLLSNSEKL